MNWRTTPAQGMSGVLTADREFALGRRGAVEGARNRYVVRDEFSVLDEGGLPVRVEVRTASMSEEVLEADAPRLRWDFDSFTHSVDGSPGADPDVFPSGGSIVFEGSPEDPHGYIPPVEEFGLAPTGRAAWMTAELVIHGRSFQLMATRMHGGIHRLRHLGEETMMPWSNRDETVRFGSLVDLTLRRGRSKLRFDGLSCRSGREVALLNCHSPFDIVKENAAGVHIEVLAQIWIDIDTGELVAGEAWQANYISVISPEGRAPESERHIIRTSTRLVE